MKKFLLLVALSFASCYSASKGEAVPRSISPVEFLAGLNAPSNNRVRLEFLKELKGRLVGAVEDKGFKAVLRELAEEYADGVNRGDIDLTTKPGR